MKKILWIVGLLVLLVIVGLAGSVVYVAARLNSEDTRRQIEVAVAERTGVKLQIERHRISLLGSALVEGVAVAQADPESASQLIKLERLAVKVRLLSLLSGRPVVEQVELQGMEITLQQTREGEIRLPFKKQEPSAAGQEEQAAAEPVRLSADVERLELNQISVTVLDAEGGKLLAMRELGGEGRASLDQGVPGAALQVRVADFLVTPGLVATGVRTPVEIKGGEGKLPKIEGDFYGGRLEGQARANWQAADQPFEARLQIRDARMEGLMKDMGSDPKTLTGALKLEFTGQGSLDAPKDLQGAGTFQIDQPVVGKLNNPLLPAGLMGMPALQTGKFDQIEGKYRIEGRQIIVEEIRVLSPGLRIGLQGTVGFDKKLDLQGRLFVDANPVTKVADIAQGFMRGLLGGKKEETAPEQASSDVLKGGVPFTVRGTTADPLVRPVGPDPLNLVSLLAKALGFSGGEPGPNPEGQTLSPALPAESLPQEPPAAAPQAP